MVGEWREATFQQLLDEGLLEIGDGYRAQNNELGGVGPIFLRAGHVRDSHIDFTGVERFHDRVADKVRSKTSKVGDTIITTRGNSTGRTSFVTDRLPPFVYSPHLSYWRSRDLKKVCPGFLRYWSQGSEFNRQLSGMKTSTDMAPYLSLTDQRRLKITLPPLPEQKAIAAVLGPLDDKIELNRRMNATLEAMARALFQSWFVDFDPVRAKAEARPPAGLDEPTAALLPTQFQDSELGLIPHAWTPGKLGGVIATTRERIGDTAAVVLSAVASSELVRSEEHFKKQVYSKSISNYLKVSQWDFAYNPSRINIGSVGMHKESVVGAVSPVYEIFRPTRSYHWFVERVLAQQSTKGWIQTLCSGSVRQSLKLKDLASIALVVPPPPVVYAFNSAWEEWHRMICANEKQSRTLSAIRDALLPQLLNGTVQPSLERA
jgi:type I restriction enzyme S subunit